MNAVSLIPVPSGLQPASGHAVAIGADASLSDVIEAFRRNPELRLLAILDDRRAPVGVIREQRVRELLFCPYWFSLMQNPTIGGSIDAMVDPCITADVSESTASLLRRASDAHGLDGLVLVDEGRFVETLSPRSPQRFPKPRARSRGLRKSCPSAPNRPAVTRCRSRARPRRR